MASLGLRVRRTGSRAHARLLCLLCALGGAQAVAEALRDLGYSVWRDDVRKSASPRLSVDGEPGYLASRWKESRNFVAVAASESCRVWVMTW